MPSRPNTQSGSLCHCKCRQIEVSNPPPPEEREGGGGRGKERGVQIRNPTLFVHFAREGGGKKSRALRNNIVLTDVGNERKKEDEK